MTVVHQASTAKEHKKASSFAGLQYYTARDYRKLLWRRKGVIVCLTFTVALLASVVAYKIPNQYQASTVILVDPGKVPESYVKSTATIDANQRLALLQQQIFSDAKLGKIADELHLNPPGHATADVDSIRKKITIDTTVGPAPGRILKSFTVSFTAQNPIVAAKVANRLAASFIEENLKVREQQVIGTAGFLDREMQKAKDDLDEKSRTLAQLRARYSEELPESQNMHLQALTSDQLDFKNEQDAEARAEQQKTSLQNLLAQSPNVVNLDAAGSAARTGLEEQLEHLQGEIAQLRSRYGPSYPDVQSKEVEIQNVQQKISDLKKDQNAAAATSSKGHNPAIEAQLEQVDEEIEKHKTRRAELASQIKYQQSAMASSPAAQQQIAEATNDVTVTSDRYKRLQDRKFGADMFSDLEAQQQTERFVLLDPAQPPQQPSFPNRGLIDGVGIGAGLVIALLVVVLMEIFDPTVKTPRELRDHIKAPIFGEIPLLEPKSTDWRKRSRSALIFAGNLVLALGYFGLLAKALK
jgi:polysaccharide chain length determinant protein (PEP-CTERM system associated)